MEPQLAFRTDLYRGAAPFYDRYRPPYPDSLFADLCRRLPVSTTGRLLDLACGTGQIAFALANRFAEVVAVDQEEEMVAFSRHKAEAADVGNIRWVTAPAETVAFDASFELVAIGNAFHRLNRQLVANRVFSWLQPAGGIALLWGDPLGRGQGEWQTAMGVLFERWMTRLGVADRVPEGWEAAMDRHPYEQVLSRAGFDYGGKFEFVAEHAWTVEALTGLVCSTSFLNREVLGDRAHDFEQDLSGLLRSYEPEGVFQVSASYAYQLGRKPGSA